MFAALWNCARKLHKQNSGFTIVEFLIVFVISSVIIAFAIPSLNSFNRWQALKTAGVELKTNLRQAQNKALAGEKACLPANQLLRSLLGWYIRFDVANFTYTIAHHCKDSSSNEETIEYSPKSYTMKGITGITFDPSNLTHILFEPVSKGVSFYNSTATPLSFTTATKLSPPDGRITITLTNVDGNSYQVVLNSAGEITDEKVL